MNTIRNAKNKLLIAYNLLSCKKFPVFKYRLSAFSNSQQAIRNLKKIRGFTLVETLVAISILMIAVASPLTIAQKGLSSAFYAKDQIIASYLAQDAIEYLRNISDRNTESGSDWLSGTKEIKDNCKISCIVDTSESLIIPCGSSCSPLKYDEKLQIYGHTSGDNSNFTRVIKVEETVPGVEALITVTMSWKDRVLNFDTRIYNWR